MTTPTHEGESPVKVAVLGGGLASLVTALELTRPGVNQGKYQVTVYQMGHRLGGKGASGRNASQHDRNEEHGLHVWLGFYENAFRLMRETLAEWNIPAGHPWATSDPKDRWRMAFRPHHYAPLADRRPQGWEIWHMHFPDRNNGTPGDGVTQDENLWTLMMRLQDSLLSIFEDARPEIAPQANHHVAAPKTDKRVREARVTCPRCAHHAGALPTAKTGCLSLLGFANHWKIASLAEEMCGLTLEELLSRPEESLRRMGIMLNLGWSLVRGLARNYWRIRWGTLDALDDKDLRAFLRDNGAHEEALNSPIASAIYDSIFAWEDGDREKESLAAGAGIRCLLHIFYSYKEALSWKMQAGMGDTIFTPMYEVLKARGVTFKFFHEVMELKLSENRKVVEKISVGRQVTLAGGASEYAPLVQVNGLGCWPSEPNWNQLVEAQAIRAGGFNLEHADSGWNCREVLTLQRGEHFDHVVLGISIGAIPKIAGELISASQPFADMTAKVKTVRTQAWQAWVKRDTPALGWPHDPPVLSNFKDPLNTWADMTFLLGRENNPDDVHGVHYFCGPLLDDVPQAGTPAEVARNVEILKNELAHSLWPRALAAGGFDNGLISHQYQRANTNASDRYVLTLPGTTKFRLKPGKSGFKNLTLTGDWTHNQFNVGCVEATVMSGRLASQAISGRPHHDEIPYSKGP